MIQPVYTNKELLEIARESYSNIIRFCEVLDQEGYWEEPQSYLKMDIFELVDIYLQSLLLNLNIYCGENGLVQRKFMLDLIASNALGCPASGDLPEGVLMQANKMMRMPPVILQLCGLRDSRENSFFTSYFLDSLLNILLANTLLDNKQSCFVDKFIDEMYEKMDLFFDADQKKHVINARYVFLKVSSDDFSKEKPPVHVLKDMRKREEEKKQFEKEQAIRLRELEEAKKKAEEELAKELEKMAVANEQRQKDLEVQEDESGLIVENLEEQDIFTKEQKEELTHVPEENESTKEETKMQKLQEESGAKEQAEEDVHQISIQEIEPGILGDGYYDRELEENPKTGLERLMAKAKTEHIEEVSEEIEKNREKSQETAVEENVEVLEKNRADQLVKKEEVESKKKSVFDYSDEELMALQKSGKLKIRMPKMEQLKKEKELAMQRLQEEKVAQIREEINKINHAKKLQGLLDELNELIGLSEVKKEIQSLINLIKVKKMRESYNMPSMDVSYHMVFTGNPGTGKTTVARLVAQIYRELGILSEGHLVEVDRSGLVAGYVGQTAMKVKEVVEKALGGVLFIDEAYSLSNKNDANDFGGEAIDTLVKLMEDHRDNLVIIVAGYKEEMDEFLKANTGLISRFNKFIDFADYTNEELLDILKLCTDRSGLVMEEDAVEEIKRALENMTQEQKLLFGNGRGMRNTFESILGKQANRIVMMDFPSESELMHIKLEDVIDIIG